MNTVERSIEERYKILLNNYYRAITDNHDIRAERDEARRWAVRLAAENNERKRRIAALVAENEALREALASIAHGPVGAWNEVEHLQEVVCHMMKIATTALKLHPDRSKPFVEEER
jgi:hypothetical protein